jgi:hypothetical protein
MKNKNDIYFLLGSIGITFLIFKLLGKNKMKPVTIKGSYSVPKDIKYREDALHSFERRKMDGFGGRMTTKINDELLKFYKNGINPDITDIKIKVDSNNYSVQWTATIAPSLDGNAYMGVVTRGSAGGSADERAKEQIPAMKKSISGASDFKLVKDFINPKGVYIRQFFYKYRLPKKYPNL